VPEKVASAVVAFVMLPAADWAALGKGGLLNAQQVATEMLHADKKLKAAQTTDGYDDWRDEPCEAPGTGRELLVAHIYCEPSVNGCGTNDCPHLYPGQVSHVVHHLLSQAFVFIAQKQGAFGCCSLSLADSRCGVAEHL
jgi:hypothetical protein